MDYISSYVFPMSEHTVSTNMVCGISLGGHAAWQCLISNPRITTAIVIIGCPDYITLMSDRARLSKLSTWTNGIPPGSHFLASMDFPTGLVEAVKKYDPAGLFLGESSSHNKDAYSREPSEAEQKRLLPLMKSALQGKRILNLAGGADKLVPYKCGEPFLEWLKKSTAKEGWFGDGDFSIKDIVFEGVGHEMSPGMAKELNMFVAETLEQLSSESTRKTSKM
jgi:pimeloyl-ACP methyl ester carboxylesterase